jgi:hypothetical protein
VGTCGVAAIYGTVGTPKRFFFEWKQSLHCNVRRVLRSGKANKCIAWWIRWCRFKTKSEY